MCQNIMKKIILKNIVKQNWSYFNIKFQPHWKDRESSYQVRKILGNFLPLNGPNFSLTQCERS